MKKWNRVNGAERDAEAAKNRAENRQAQDGMMDRQSIRVLMVEDDEDDYIITRDLLEENSSQRFVIVWARDLASGLLALDTEIFDVVLLDLSLPDSRGLPTFSALHAQARSVPVILLTGLSDEFLGIKAVQDGAQDYLVKGDLDAHLLVRAILYAIERKKTKEQLESYAKELRLKNLQMAEDLDLAREIQQALLPSVLPTVPDGVEPAASVVRFSFRYIPSTAVGGDFFSVSNIPEHEVAVFVCDVMGHGMRAALVTAIIRGLQEELKPTAGDPGEFLTQLNRGFSAILSPLEHMIFASAVYQVLDIRTGVLRYASAGHPPPFRISPARREVGPVVSPLSLNEPALGIDPRQSYSTSCTQLEPGDTVVLFTDGLYEVSGPDQSEFGLDGVEHALRELIDTTPETIIEQLINTVRHFSGNGPFADDVCIVAENLDRLFSG